MKTLILDNYDSFTYNLHQYVAEFGGAPIVKRNDEVSLAEIEKMKPTHIIISPGPGTSECKEDFKICGPAIKKFAGKIPILGVCLGHQGIVHEFGGKIIKAPSPMHGKTSWVKILGGKLGEGSLFRGLPKRINVMRYHSLIVDRKSLPEDFVVTAETEKDKLIMAVQHKKFPLWGIQFHPESIGTPTGKGILRNFLKAASACLPPS